MATHIEDYSDDDTPAFFPMTETRRLREIYVNPEEAEHAAEEYARTIIDRQNTHRRPAVEGILAIEEALRNAQPNQAVEVPPEYLDNVLAQRNAIHGDFTDDATTAQALKYIMRKGKNWEDMPAYMCEALDQMQTKIARILAGDFNHPDHWKDLQGYPRLVELRL